MPRSLRCIVDGLVIRVTATGLARRIALGEIVDLDEALSQDCTMGSAIAGRDDCFEAIAADDVPRKNTRVKSPSAPVAPDDAKASQE